MRLTRLFLQVDVDHFGSGVASVALGDVRFDFDTFLLLLLRGYVVCDCEGWGCGACCFGLRWVVLFAIGEVHVADCPLWLGHAVT